MNTGAVTIRVDSGAVAEMLADARRLFDSSPRWLQYLAAQAFENLHEGIQLVSVDADRDPASGTGNVWVLAKPTDQLLLLVSALRAGNGEPRGLIDFDFHAASCGWVGGSHLDPATGGSAST